MSKWMTKRDVAALLNVSEKSVDRHTARGSLTRRTRPRVGMVAQSVYDPATVERLRLKLMAERELALNAVSLAVEPDTSETVETTDLTVSVNRPSGLESVLQALQRLPQATALYLSWDEARRYTGLSESTLRAAVRDGLVATRAYGRGVRLRRRDLDRL